MPVTRVTLKPQLGFMSHPPLPQHGENALVGLTPDLMFELDVWVQLVGDDHDP